jgi:hypothetical protein
MDKDDIQIPCVCAYIYEYNFFFFFYSPFYPFKVDVGFKIII